MIVVAALYERRVYLIFGGHRPPLQLWNSLPEFRRCAIEKDAFSLGYENFKLSCYSTENGGRNAEIGPIFVHAEPCERYTATQEFPADFREARVFRAYNSKQDMIDAAVVNDRQPEAVIEKLLQNPEIAFVDVRSVTRGCYTFRIERI